MTSDHHTPGTVGDQLPEDLVELYRSRVHQAGLPTPGHLEPRLPVLGEVRAVLFDVYGTLVQSTAGEISLHDENGGSAPFYRLAEALETPIPFDRVEALSRRFREKIETVHSTRRALGVDHPEVDIITIWHALTEEFPELRRGGQEGAFSQARRLALRYELEANPVAEMPGARKILRELSQRSFRLGIISNAQFYTPLLFPLLFGGTPEELGIEVAVWSFRLGEAKPSRTLFEEGIKWFAQAYCLRPEELLMVGNDLKKDIAPAAAAGMKTALFAGDSRSLRLYPDEPSLAGVEADAVLTDLAQLQEVLP